jgi:hypothetical protein
MGVMWFAIANDAKKEEKCYDKLEKHYGTGPAHRVLWGNEQ